MRISNYQIDSVIKTYVKNMKIKAGRIEKDHEEIDIDDELNISKEGIKKMIYERMKKQMAEKLKKNVHRAA